jgi:hypothetical protein
MIQLVPVLIMHTILEYVVPRKPLVVLACHELVNLGGVAASLDLCVSAILLPLYRIPRVPGFSIAEDAFHEL